MINVCNDDSSLLNKEDISKFIKLADNKEEGFFDYENFINKLK